MDVAPQKSAAALRRTGIDVVGDAPWGTHFCQFYATKDDLRDILVPYFKAGLESDEFCMWVTSPPLGVEEAWEALAQAVPDLDSHRRRGRIEILPHTDWYLRGGKFEQDRVLGGWVSKLEDALARGCAGLRLTGNTFWLEKSDWRSFAEYEAAVDGVIGRYRILALCTYAADRCDASEVADVIRNHQFALIKRQGRWELFESFDRRRMQDAIRRQNAILTGMARIFEEALACETEEHLGRVCLSVAEEVTHSQFAFIGEINPRTGMLDDIAISDTGWDACRMEVSSGHGERLPPRGFRIRGLYGRVLEDGKAFFANDPRSHPAYLGTPRGHPPLHAFLGVPLLHAGKTIGVMALGNRQGGYGAEELEAAETLAAAIVQALFRKRAEEEVRNANAQLTEAARRKDEFLGMLSHELRNPLAPIRNCIYILEHSDPAGEQARRAREVIARQAEHLTRLVDDLLDVTRIARGKIELKPDRLDLAVLVRRAAEDHATLMRERGIELSVDVPREPMWTHGDSTRLAQVVGNLLHNSAKFTGRGGQVKLALEAARGAAEIHVRDTGVGIEPDLLMRVFEPFVQGERTLARTDGGLGLGLALVKGITELHGGSVRAASAGTGQGAELVVRLPLVDVGAADARALRGPGRTEVSRRVLVIDDNEDAAQTLAELVEMFGHTADVAYDGPSALARARENPPDVVFCDIGLPGMSGYEVVRSLRSDEVLRRAQVFALSGHAQPEDRRRATDAGFDGHLAKPSDPDEIERILS